MAHGILVAKDAETKMSDLNQCVQSALYSFQLDDYNLEVFKNYATLTCSLKFQLSTIKIFLNEVIISKRPYSKLQSSAELNFFFQLRPFFPYASSDLHPE